MDVVMSARQLAGWKHGTEYPTATQVNSVTQKIRDGVICHAEKVLGCWYVNCTREWPELFPPERDAADMSAMGDLLIALGKAMKEGCVEGNGSGGE